MKLKTFLNYHIDKVVHFLSGLSLSLMLGDWPFWSFMAVCVCAIGKEVADYYGGGTPDIVDAAVTIAGGAIGLLWFALVLR